MLDLKALLSKICKVLGFVDIQTYSINGNFTVRRIWHIVNISYNGNVKAYTHSTWNTITTLPVGQRPSSTVNFLVAENNTYDITKCALMGRVLASGEVQVWLYGGSPSTNQPYFNVTYVVDGGGYLTSKFYSIFSHLERWWEYVRFKGVAGEGADQSPVVVLQCVRERLPRLLQGAKSWQSCSCLGRILKWLDNHARCLSCVDNIITTIQTIAERQICMWRIGWNARDNRLRQHEWDCVSIYNGNHCILEFHSNLLCGIISDRGCFYA